MVFSIFLINQYNMNSGMGNTGIECFYIGNTGIENLVTIKIPRLIQ